ncbi:unannotated protein [freshwater metagenome]|uniref:Unannotated protein n=1 Tax=freshwater metagenome TaxID=449393 RepID=A0A6J7DRB7_9ZZZZ
MLIDAELNLAALDVGDGLGDVHGHRAGLRVRHQATRAQDLAEGSDLAHEVRGRHCGVEVGPAALDLLDQVVGADEIGTCSPRFIGLLAVGEDQDPGGLAGAVREVDGAADHLVGLARVDAEADRHLNSRVELRRDGALGDADGGERRVQLVGVDLLGGLHVCLAALHCCSFAGCGRRAALALPLGDAPTWSQDGEVKRNTVG